MIGNLTSKMLAGVNKARIMLVEKGSNPNNLYLAVSEAYSGMEKLTVHGMRVYVDRSLPDDQWTLVCIEPILSGSKNGAIMKRLDE